MGWLAAAVVLAGPGCTTSESRGAQSESLRAGAREAYPVRWARVRALEGGEDWIDLEAVLNSPTRVPLAFKVAGRIAALDCEEGAIVVPDPARPVGRLETRDYELARAAAVATLRRAQAAYRRARGVGIAHAARELERGRAVAGAGVIAERDLSGLETQLRDMEAQAGEAAAAVLQAEALVAQAEQALADTTLVAPFRGLVVKRMAEPGQLVGQGTPACVVERIDELDALASLPGNLLPALVRDRRPLVTVHDAGDVQVEGTIAAAAWAGDVQTGTFPVKVRIANAGDAFRSGMSATVRLWLRRGGAEPGETVYEVPLEALVALAGKTWLFAPVDESRATVRRIEAQVRELGRDGLARVTTSFPGPLLVVSEGQYTLLETEAPVYAVREVAPP